MRKYSIKISLIYGGAFVTLMVLLQLSSVLHVFPLTFVAIVNAAWFAMALRISYTIKRESIQTKLCVYVPLFIVQLTLNILVNVTPLFGSIESTLLGIFNGIAMSVTVLTTIFFVARSIQREKFYMLMLKYFLYIIFVLGIIITMPAFGMIIVDAYFILQVQGV